MISIVIPTYGERTQKLERAIDSIRNQTFSEFEVIVVNDFSSEESMSQNQHLVGRYSEDIDIRYFQNSTRRYAPYSRNFGASKAKYDYISFLDDDDFWYEEKLSTQVAEIRKHPELDLLVTNADIFYEDTEEYQRSAYTKPKGDLVKCLLRKNFVPSPSNLVKKEVFDSVEGYDLTLESCQDWDLWVRIASLGKVRFIDRSLVVYVKHSSGSIGTSDRALWGYTKFLSKHRKLYENYSLEEEFDGYIKYVIKQSLQLEHQKGKEIIENLPPAFDRHFYSIITSNDLLYRLARVLK